VSEVCTFAVVRSAFHCTCYADDPKVKRAGLKKEQSRKKKRKKKG
jgi:hypothetical protein